MAQRLPPPPASRPASHAPAQAAEPVDGSRFAISTGRIASPQRVVVYGTGGIGKTSLAALAPNPVFVDLEGGTMHMDVPRVQIDDWASLRALLQSDKLDGFGTIVIDGATKAEEFAVAHTLATVPSEKGVRVHRIEDYGYGKGYQHIYDTYLLLLQDLDSQVRRGRHVVMIAHECISDCPNPLGENFIRYEPHLQAPKSGKASIRNRVVQWASHVIYVGYDVAADKGKGYGSGTRSIYTQEMPSHIAKTRGAFDPAQELPPSMPFTKGDGTVWSYLFGGV